MNLQNAYRAFYKLRRFTKSAQQLYNSITLNDVHLDPPILCKTQVKSQKFEFPTDSTKEELTPPCILSTSPSLKLHNITLKRKRSCIYNKESPYKSANIQFIFALS